MLICFNEYFIISVFHNFYKYTIRDINGQNCALANVKVRFLHFFRNGGLYINTHMQARTLTHLL